MEPTRVMTVPSICLVGSYIWVRSGDPNEEQTKLESARACALQALLTINKLVENPDIYKLVGEVSHRPTPLTITVLL